MTRRTFLPLPLAGTAAAGSARPLTLGILADPQYADKDVWKQRHYRASLDKLRRAIRRLNELEPDAVLTLGDFIDEDFASFAPVMKVYGELRGRHLKVVGNHDFSVDEERKDEVFDALSMVAPHASHEFDGWRVVLLDGTEVSTYRPRDAETAREWLGRLEREGRPQAQPWNSAIGRAQLAWLEEQLQAATDARQRVLVACHLPVFPEDPHNLWNDRELVALVDRFPCVAAWFAGHNHAGHYGRRGHCHYLTFQGMVETADHAPFAVARLFPDRIEIDGFDTEPDRRLPAATPR